MSLSSYLNIQFAVLTYFISCLELLDSCFVCKGRCTCRCLRENKKGKQRLCYH